MSSILWTPCRQPCILLFFWSTNQNQSIKDAIFHLNAQFQYYVPTFISFEYAISGFVTLSWSWRHYFHHCTFPTCKFTSCEFHCFYYCFWAPLGKMALQNPKWRIVEMHLVDSAYCHFSNLVALCHIQSNQNNCTEVLINIYVRQSKKYQEVRFIKKYHAVVSFKHGRP